MRPHRFAAIAAAAVLAAGCGSSSSGGSSTTPESLAGNVLGQPFTPAEIAFVGPADASCAFPGPTPVTYGNSAILIAFAAPQGACALATDPCTGHRNLTMVAGTVAHAKLGATAAPGLQTGTYTVYANVTDAVPDANGDIRAAILEAVHTDAATCAETVGAAATGTIRLDAIGATGVTGRVDVTFPDGGFLRGPFVASRCAATFQVCEGSPDACGGTFTCP